MTPSNQPGRILTASIVALGLFAATAVQAADGKEAISPEASSILQKSLQFLAAQSRFSVDSSSSIELVTEAGQKLQFHQDSRLTVQRPDKMRAERSGEVMSSDFYYDGKQLTVYNPQTRFYATTPAPADLDATLAFARDKLNIVSPAGDLIYSNAYAIMTQGVESGFVVGKTSLGGVRCTHLAFRAPDTDWQIWIEDSKTPFPRKLVITSLDVPGNPQFTIDLSNWNRKPQIKAGMFEFHPGKNARRVDFLPVSGN